VLARRTIGGASATFNKGENVEGTTDARLNSLMAMLPNYGVFDLPNVELTVLDNMMLKWDQRWMSS
jgi:hypothetical protein